MKPSDITGLKTIVEKHGFAVVAACLNGDTVERLCDHLDKDKHPQRHFEFAAEDLPEGLQWHDTV
jgi:hypothetical protein